MSVLLQEASGANTGRAESFSPTDRLRAQKAAELIPQAGKVPWRTATPSVAFKRYPTPLRLRFGTADLGMAAPYPKHMEDKKRER